MVNNRACPSCGPPHFLKYYIAKDAYVCDSCDRCYEVLSVETDHVLYDGGPPREMKGVD